MVMVIVAVATGIGSFASGGVLGFFVGIVGGVGLWAMWAWITHYIGTTILKTEATKPTGDNWPARLVLPSHPAY